MTQQVEYKTIALTAHCTSQLLVDAECIACSALTNSCSRYFHAWTQTVLLDKPQIATGATSMPSMPKSILSTEYNQLITLIQVKEL